MGKKMDALLGKSFKASKFKATANLAVSRLAVLKNQRQARCSVATSDVVQFLKSNNHDRALLRVEQVIKEQNMLDVFVLLETYCHLLLDRVNLIEHEKVCPEELKEGVSSLIYAATRCGEFPELQEIRVIFTSRFGKEFVSRAVELRNNCGVNPKIIQKLSTRMPSLETKIKVLKEIASANDIVLQIEEPAPAPPTTQEDHYHHNPSQSSQVGLDNKPIHFEEEKVDDFSSGSGNTPRRRKYKDVADAAQAAFESAAYAAAAARAAVELSRSESTDPDDPKFRTRKVVTEPMKSLVHHQTSDDEHAHMRTGAEFEKMHSFQGIDIETEMKRSLSISSSESEEGDDHKKQQHLPLKPAEMELENNRRVVEPLNINRRPISVRTMKPHAR